MQHITPADRPPTARDARRAGITAFVGTTIEWFDFYIYGSASALVLGKVFFADIPPAVGTLAAFATFWVGFLARPLGGLIFGHYGDRHGRKKALITTLVMMGTATFCVGLLPGYAQIGVAAPVLLVLLRMVQGVAMGGEWGGAVLIATEYAPPKRKLLYGAFAQQGSPVGNLLATLAFLGIARLPDAAFESWGWRVPFLASAVLVAIGLVIRLRLAETPEMLAVLERKQTAKLPIKVVLTRYPLLVALGVLAGTAGVAITYIKTTFALSWATSDIGFDRTTFLTAISLTLVVQVVVQPFGAVLMRQVAGEEGRAVDARAGVRRPAADVHALRHRQLLARRPRDGAGDFPARHVLRGAGGHPRPGLPRRGPLHRNVPVVPALHNAVRRDRTDRRPVPAHRLRLDLAGRRSGPRLHRRDPPRGAAPAGPHR